MDKSRVYIKTDENDTIIRIEGEYTLPEDLTGWIKVTEGEGDRYNLAQTHFLPKGLMDFEGNYNYKYVDGKFVEI